VKKPRARVTDNALVRFLERVGGVDVATIRLAIGKAVDEAVELGANAVIIDGFRYVIREDDTGPLVVTVEPRSQETPIRRSGRQRDDAGGGEA
jgi:uncharacterized protein YneR